MIPQGHPIESVETAVGKGQPRSMRTEVSLIPEYFLIEVRCFSGKTRQRVAGKCGGNRHQPTEHCTTHNQRVPYDLALVAVCESGAGRSAGQLLADPRIAYPMAPKSTGAGAGVPVRLAAESGRFALSQSSRFILAPTPGDHPGRAANALGGMRRRRPKGIAFFQLRAGDPPSNPWLRLSYRP